MTPVPLAELGLRPSHQRSALWWLGLLYRQSANFEHEIKNLQRRIDRIRVGVTLYFHAIPAIIIAILIFQFLIFEVLHAPTIPLTYDSLFFSYSIWIVEGIGTGVIFAATTGTTSGMAAGLAYGVAFGVACGILAGIGNSNDVFDNILTALPIGLALGVASGIAFKSAHSVPGGTIRGIARGAAGITVFAGMVIIFQRTNLGISDDFKLFFSFAAVFSIAGGIISVVFICMILIASGDMYGACSLGLMFVTSRVRAYYIPLHYLWLLPKTKPAMYQYHPVAWDDMCSIRFVGLCRLLADLWIADNEKGQREIYRIINTYSSQRLEGLKALLIVTAYTTVSENDLERLEERVAGLPEGSTSFLLDVSRLKGMVAEIARCQRRLTTVEAPAFRESLTSELVVKIERFKDRIVGLQYPLADEFRRAADAWLVVAQRQQATARGILESAPAAQVFRAGDPVDKEAEAFVPRLERIAELQGQVTLATGCPGLLLYGRRRMGKSTLVRNAEPFLPTSIRVTYLSMQDATAFGSLDGLLAAIVHAAAGDAGSIGDLGAFHRRLGEIDRALAAADRRLVIAIDEYEMIDAKIGEGVFPRDLLAAFRESIQTHRRIVWLFAGSHAIEELGNADWGSAFVSLRTLELTPFSDAETRLLLTEPLARSSLWKRDEARRPRFDPTFWGEGGIERVHAETAGWPHLVQLVAETVVELVNLRGLKAASPELLEEALRRSVSRGDVVLRQLLQRECSLEGEWAYIEGFRAAEVQAEPADGAVRRSLRRRLMVTEAEGGGWRLRVPLMRRWLIERG